MTTNRSSVIEFNDEQDVQSELQFQDFSLTESTSGVATLSPTGTYANFPDSPNSGNVEAEDLLGTGKKEGSPFWRFSYYQSFFDIETSDFTERLKWSFIPVLGRATFLDRQIRPKPDLYGPFWITFCLIYSTAIMTNVANYFNGSLHEKKHWTFNFHRVSLAATVIYAYVFVLPIILWGILKHFQYSNRYTLLEIICVYGYSLAIFVPISIFWIIDAVWLHWILVITGIIVSGAVLLQVFWPIFRDDNKKTGTILLCVILICHVLLGVGFGTLFFQQRVDWVSTSTTVGPVQSTISADVSSTTAIDSLNQKISRSITEENKVPGNSTYSETKKALLSENNFSNIKKQLSEKTVTEIESSELLNMHSKSKILQNVTQKM